MIENLRLINAVSSASAWTSRASAETPSQSFLPKGESYRNARRDSGSDVSKTVASAKTTRRSLSVWYVFCATPQHMPLELLFTMPPIMHESMDAGSGPRRYLRAGLDVASATASRFRDGASSPRRWLVSPRR